MLPMLAPVTRRGIGTADDLGIRQRMYAVWCHRVVKDWLPRGSLRRDLAIAGACLSGGLVMFAVTLPSPYTLIPLAVISGAVALRRIASLTSLGIGVAALTADLSLGGSLATVFIFTQVLYDACTYGPPWLWRWLLRVSIALTAVGTVVGLAVTRDRTGLAVGVAGVLILVVPVLTGITVRQYRDQAEAEHARAVVEERTRMARELHDVVANQLSAVAIHATAVLSKSDLNQPAVRESLQVIRESSVQGLAEMRQMIDLLRDPVRLADADRLVEQARKAGLDVTFDITGPARSLPANVDLTAYRILQESLANALKHGNGVASVAVAYQADRVTLTVRNPISSSLLPRGGAGLAGMRERASLLGGTVDAGPCGADWRVYAELPA